MPLKLDVLMQSLEPLQPVMAEFMGEVYTNLIQDNPAMRWLDSTDLVSFLTALLSILGSAVRKEYTKTMLEARLQELGARQAQQGILPRHYPLLGSAILKSMQHALGSDLTAEARREWMNTYWHVTRLLQEGALSTHVHAAVMVNMS